MNPAEYEIMYRVENTHWWYHNLHALVCESLQRFLPPNRAQNKLIADIGCGTGAVLQRLDIFGTTFGLDIAPEALTCCKRRSLYRLCRASASGLPYPENVFDAAVMLDVLYHRQVTDPARPLAEAWRALKPGGLLIVNVPAYAWLRSSHDRAVHTERRFTRSQTISLMREAGFEVLQSSYWNTLLFPPIVLVRLIKRWLSVKASDLEGSQEGFVNTVLQAVLGLERRLMRLAPLPFGLSVFAVARKSDRA
jgi:SAM-dependent methyltransferase